MHPKILELPPYNHLPHLLSPLITHLKPPTQTLKSTLQQIQKRYKFFPQYHLTNITPFNKKPPYHQRIPKILILIHHLPHLIIIPPQHLQQSIPPIPQKPPPSRIHILLPTQPPSLNLITPLIKPNIPTTIPFILSSTLHSRTI
ncbi:FtsK/SpoIIIE domain-containing protein, partial [Staphylococcus epidermidis]|uniref:FtsK/SpoIIIE domain-containing protein n=1 Tax=Staphylococcus epidermidis TaxID=1282 RepID=UPI0037D9E93C